MYCDKYKRNCTYHLIKCKDFGKDCPRVTDNKCVDEPKVVMANIRLI